MQEHAETTGTQTQMDGVKTRGTWVEEEVWELVGRVAGSREKRREKIVIGQKTCRGEMYATIATMQLTSSTKLCPLSGVTLHI